MILSHERRFIFLKTRKTGGTSLEIALSGICGSDDVITPLGPPDEAIRASLGHRGPQHYEGPAAIPDPRPHRLGMRFYNHMPAAEVREAVGPQVWRDYLKIAVERHPWDKAMSMYYWRFKEPPRPPLLRFLRRQEKASARSGHPPALSNWPVYAVGDAVVADIVLAYERLEDETELLSRLLDLPHRLRMVHAKRLDTPDRRPYRIAMGQPERDVVARLCHREIRRFGYEF